MPSHTIAVVLPDSGVVAWKKAAQVLTMRGYGFKSTDKELLTLNTEGKSVARTGQGVIHATVIGRTVLVDGSFDTHFADNGPTRITYRGMQGSPFMVAWNELSEIAQALGGTVEYKQTP